MKSNALADKKTVIWAACDEMLRESKELYRILNGISLHQSNQIIGKQVKKPLVNIGSKDLI
ncbi:hypothetical protein [Vibrio hyugaensis]|uniref:hypothetical protein n=1 Tax=Vibrio hyugaensis TaxID=1534743 RepID=UPI000CE36FA7|nr:hypothetical protein [Vibrio hyugaensis]